MTINKDWTRPNGTESVLFRTRREVGDEVVTTELQVTTPATYDDDGNELTAAVEEWVEVERRPRTAEENAAIAAAEAKALVPDLSDDDVKKTVAVSAENDFRTDGWFAVHRQMWHGLLDTLVGLGVVTEQQIGALRITEAHTQAVLDGAAQAIVQMKDPTVREAFTGARIKDAEQRGRP